MLIYIHLKKKILLLIFINLKKNNKNAKCEVRTHDLKIMRLTRCRLRQLRLAESVRDCTIFQLKYIIYLLAEIIVFFFFCHEY